MRKPDIDVLTVLVIDRGTNNWAVRVPNRQYPGIVLQGDSLKVLFDLTDELCDLVSGASEMRDVAEELRENLRGRLQIYEKALRDHSLELLTWTAPSSGLRAGRSRWRAKCELEPLKLSGSSD